MIKRRFTPFNDGYLFVVEVNKAPSDFGAKKNAETATDLTKVVKLAYQTMSARDDDLDFAERQGRTLSMKVRTRAVPCTMKKTHSVVIGNKLFSIVKLDIDREKGEMYFYLEEEREVLCPF